MYLASLGPNYTNLAECTLNAEKPDFAPLIASGALDGVREVKFGKYREPRCLRLFRVCNRTCRNFVQREENSIPVEGSRTVVRI